MNLSAEDMAYLLGIGNLSRDIAQIERAIAVTTFQYRGKRISRDQAISLLGHQKFLSGMSRSAFHWSACRETEAGEPVFFDSSRLFKGI